MKVLETRVTRPVLPFLHAQIITGRWKCANGLKTPMIDFHTALGSTTPPGSPFVFYSIAKPPRLHTSPLVYDIYEDLKPYIVAFASASHQLSKRGLPG